MQTRSTTQSESVEHAPPIDRLGIDAASAPPSQEQVLLPDEALQAF
jgi:hypothetical protein